MLRQGGVEAGFDAGPADMRRQIDHRGDYTGISMEAIADQANLRGTGARGLRAIMEEVLLSVMYEVPSRKDVERVVITREAVLENVNPTIVPRDVSLRTPREKSA